jgi:hypothetical protein
MTDSLFLGEPLPFRQRFGFGEMFLSREDGMGVRGWELGDGPERGTGDGQGEEALDEVLGGRSGSIEEVGFEVGAVKSQT